MYDTLYKRRSIWSEREIILDELNPSIWQNIESRGCLSICFDLVSPPPTTIIREFNSNLFVHTFVSSSQFLTTWINGSKYEITAPDVSDAHSVPFIENPAYPYANPPSMDDVVSVHCGTLIVWAGEPRHDKNELTKDNYIFYRIACYNVLPLSHIYIVLTSLLVFLFGFIIVAFMCLPSLFIHFIVDIHRNSASKQKLFLLELILRVLEHLRFECSFSSELVHQIAPIRATFHKMSISQKKKPTKAKAKGKRARVDPPQEDVEVDPVVDIAMEGDDDDSFDDDVGAAEPIDDPPATSSVQSMLERMFDIQAVQGVMMQTFMTTQVVHGQLLDSLITNVVALRVDFIEFRSIVMLPPSPSFD